MMRINDNQAASIFATSAIKSALNNEELRESLHFNRCLLIQAHILISTGEIERGVKHIQLTSNYYQKLKNNDPNYVNYLLTRGSFFLQVNKPTEALNDYILAWSKSGDHYFGSYKNIKFNDSGTVQIEGETQYPLLAESMLGLAQANYSLGKSYAAAGWAESVVSLLENNSHPVDPFLGECYRVLATTQSALGYYELADRNLKKLEYLFKFLKPENDTLPGYFYKIRKWEFYLEKAKLTFKAGDHVKALIYAQDALDIIYKTEGKSSFSAMPVWELMAEIYLDTGDHEKALQVLLAVSERAKEHPLAKEQNLHFKWYLLMAEVFVLKGNFVQSERLLKYVFDGIEKDDYPAELHTRFYAHMVFAETPLLQK